MARPTPQDKLRIEERRRKVAEQWLAHQTQQAIADELGVKQQTVSHDIAVIKAQYRAERTEILDREAAELDEIEQECAARYRGDQAGEWLDRRLKVKERRAKLLGLDAPTKLEQSGPGGGPLRVVVGWDDDAPEDTDTGEAQAEG